MPGHVSVNDTLTLINAIREIQDVTGKTERACQERLRQLEGTLQQTRQEESFSRGLLEAARAVEAAMAAKRATADARMTKAAAHEAAAVASGNPIAIAIATAEVAAAAPPLHEAVAQHEKAKAHRLRLEQRLEKAVKCVHLAQDTLEKLQTAFRVGCGAVKAAAFPGLERLSAAYGDAQEYLTRFQASASVSMPALSGRGAAVSPHSVPDVSASMPQSVFASAGQSASGVGLFDENPSGAFGQSPEESLSNEQPTPDSAEIYDGKTCYYDDNGNLYRTDNDLIPDAAYEINGYRYQTDGQSRITSVEGTLHMKDREGRLEIRDSIEAIGKGDQRPGDDRGHLIGDQFDGANGLENMIPQNADINRKDFRNLENQLAAEVKQGKSVQAKVEPLYSGDSRRPDAVVVTYRVDGGSEEVVFFPNPLQGADGTENA